MLSLIVNTAHASVRPLLIDFHNLWKGMETAGCLEQEEKYIQKGTSSSAKMSSLCESHKLTKTKCQIGYSLTVLRWAHVLCSTAVQQQREEPVLLLLP